MFLSRVPFVPDFRLLSFKTAKQQCMLRLKVCHICLRISMSVLKPMESSLDSEKILELNRLSFDALKRQAVATVSRPNIEKLSNKAVAAVSIFIGYLHAARYLGV